MVILQVIHSFPPYVMGGTEIYTYNLACELSRNNEVFIFHRVCDQSKEEYEIAHSVDNGINIYTINNTFKNCDSFEMIYRNDALSTKFSEILSEIKPDVVHIQHLVFLSINLINEIKKKRIPIVFTLHDYWLICQQWFFLRDGLMPCNGDNVKECVDCLGELLSIKKMPKRAYVVLRNILPLFLIRSLKTTYFSFEKKIGHFSEEAVNKIKTRKQHIEEMCILVDKFISPSWFLKNKLENLGLLRNRVTHIAHGLNKDIFNGFRRKKSPIIRFGFLGTILPAKGVDILIRAFSTIQRNNIELRIHGKLYPYRRFEYYPSHIRNLSKKKNILFMGAFDNKDVAHLFSEIDVLIVPSVWEETFSLVIQEAFLSKTPVIASRIGGIPELVTDGVNGLLFKPGNIDDLREKMQYMIDNPSVIEKFRQNMPQVKSIEDNAKEMEAIYSQLIAQKDHEKRYPNLLFSPIF